MSDDELDTIACAIDALRLLRAYLSGNDDEIQSVLKEGDPAAVSSVITGFAMLMTGLLRPIADVRSCSVEDLVLNKLTALLSGE